MKIDWIKQAFSDGGAPSSSRILSAVCTLAVIGWCTYYVIKERKLPDGVTMGGLATFGTSHYVANRVTGIFTKSDPAGK